MQEETMKIHEDILNRLLDYSKYLYEEENERRDRLNDAVKIYIGFLMFILGIGALKFIPSEELILLTNIQTYPILSGISLILLAVSVICFFISFIFTILVLKMWPFERLCDPKITAIKSLFLDSENDFILLTILDYVVACNVNHKINNEKSKLLSNGLKFLIGGLILFIIGLILAKGLFLIEGGAK